MKISIIIKLYFIILLVNIIIFSMPKSAGTFFFISPPGVSKIPFQQIKNTLGRVIYIAFAHRTTDDFIIHTQALNEAQKHAAENDQEFFLIIDFAGPNWLPGPHQMLTDDLIDMARENPDALESLRKYFKYYVTVFQSAVDIVNKGTMPDLSSIEHELIQALIDEDPAHKDLMPDVHSIKDELIETLLKWAVEKNTHIILENIQFEDWLLEHWAEGRLERAMTIFVNSGLETEQDREEYIRYMNDFADAMAISIKNRNKGIIKQVIHEIKPNISLGLLYGAGHLGIFEGLEKEKVVTIRGRTSFNQQQFVSYLAATGIACRLAIGEDIDKDEKEFNYFINPIYNNLEHLARQRDKTDFLRISEVVGKIAGRWEMPGILKFAKAIKREASLLENNATIRFLLEWLKKHGSDEEKRFFKIDLSAPQESTLVSKSSISNADIPEMVRDMVPKKHPPHISKQAYESFINDLIREAQEQNFDTEKALEEFVRARYDAFIASTNAEVEPRSGSIKSPSPHSEISRQSL